jgi:hypothetical protein
MAHCIGHLSFALPLACAVEKYISTLLAFSWPDSSLVSMPRNARMKMFWEMKRLLRVAEFLGIAAGCPQIPVIFGWVKPLPLLLSSAVSFMWITKPLPRLIKKKKAIDFWNGKFFIALFGAPLLKNINFHLGIFCENLFKW